MRRFDTLVAALDLGPAADRALPVVAALARGRNLTVELLAVVGDASGASSVSGELERRAALHGLPRHELFVIRAGAPGPEIVEHISGRDGALLVIATTAHGGPDEHQLGVVTDEVLRRARRPIVVVGPRAEVSPGCLLVVVDATTGADWVIPVVERWTGTFGRDQSPRIAQLQAPDPWPEHWDDERARGVDRHVGELAARGVVATGEVLEALDPVAGILGHLDRTKAAMVAVTSPGDIGQPSHWFLTTRRLIRSARRPVLVVPADPRPPGP